jgi:hypothetical protein
MGIMKRNALLPEPKGVISGPATILRVTDWHWSVYPAMCPGAGRTGTYAHSIRSQHQVAREGGPIFQGDSGGFRINSCHNTRRLEHGWYASSIR